ncbi:MAG TPA: hypothetical protein DIC42_03625 [Holosporales bacterium]|nr:hypothetical protein [Holosporales bacterium]
MKREELLFDNLYAKCIQEWPESLNLELKSEVSQTLEAHPDGYQLIKCKYGPWNGNKQNYYVESEKKSLDDLYDYICSKYYGKKEE